MALTDESSGIPATMLVGPASVGSAAPYPYPVYSGGGGNQGFGGEGGWWIVLLFILIAAMGGWGNNQSGGFGSQPVIVNDGGSSVQRGFDQAATMAGLSGIQSGIYGLSTQLCGCCGDIQMALCNGFAGTAAAVTGAQNAIAQQMYASDMAALNRSFAEQTANTAGFTGVNAGLADLKYTVATEACNDRAALSQGIQTVLDKLCQLELDGYKRENDQLRSQLSAANLAASQIDQTARILAGQTAEVDALYNRLSNCPVPSVPVYGRQPIFTCPTPQSSCGCGCGNSSF